jgi:hypothetical protein
MPVAINPFADALWTMLIAFLWFASLALLFRVIGDIVQRRPAYRRAALTQHGGRQVTRKPTNGTFGGRR